MVIADAVNLIIHVNREWNAVETITASATAKAARVVRLSHCLQDLQSEH